jgi:hypothetical protein
MPIGRGRRHVERQQPLDLVQQVERIAARALSFDKSTIGNGGPVARLGYDLSPHRDAAAIPSEVHDANVVATMLAHGERRLLTFNETDFGASRP